MEYGLTADGLVIKRLEDIKEEIEQTMRDTFGDNLNLSEETPEGQVVNIFAERESYLWELIEEVYNSHNPNANSGVSQDNIAQITGSTRLSAEKSTIEGQALFGTVGTTIPAGTQISVPGTTNIFKTLSAKTLGAGVDEIQKLAASNNPTSGTFKLQHRSNITAAINFNATSGDIQTALRALSSLSEIVVSGAWPLFTLTFSGEDGKQDQPLIAVVDNNLQDGGGSVSLTPSVDTSGEYQAQVNMEALETGPKVALAYTCTQIENPISGFTKTLNPNDAEIGRDEETDDDFRIRREEEVERAGAATVETIRAGLLDVEDVEQAIVFENDTNIADINGVPPHSIHCYLNGGDEDDIAEKIWEKKGGGITTYGNITKQITDSQGVTHDIKFSRPVEKDIYVIIDVVDEATYPGDSYVVQKILEYGASLSQGDDVRPYATNGMSSYISQVAGISDFEIKIGTAPGPVSDANISIGVTEISNFESANITVNS